MLALTFQQSFSAYHLVTSGVLGLVECGICARDQAFRRLARLAFGHAGAEGNQHALITIHKEILGQFTLHAGDHAYGFLLRRHRQDDNEFLTAEAR